jgi:hypothetical protein
MAHSYLIRLLSFSLCLISLSGSMPVFAAGSELSNWGSADYRDWGKFNPYKFEPSARLVPSPRYTAHESNLYLRGVPVFPHDPCRTNIIFGRGTKKLPTVIYAKAFDVLRLGEKYYQSPAAGKSKELTVDGQTVTIYGTSLYTPLADQRYVANTAQIKPFDPSLVFYKDKSNFPSLVYAKPGEEISIMGQKVTVPAAGKSVLITISRDGKIKDGGGDSAKSGSQDSNGRASDKSSNNGDNKLASALGGHGSGSSVNSSGALTGAAAEKAAAEKAAAEKAAAEKAAAEKAAAEKAAAEKAAAEKAAAEKAAAEKAAAEKAAAEKAAAEKAAAEQAAAEKAAAEKAAAEKAAAEKAAGQRSSDSGGASSTSGSSGSSSTSGSSGSSSTSGSSGSSSTSGSSGSSSTSGSSGSSSTSGSSGSPGSPSTSGSSGSSSTSGSGGSSSSSSSPSAGSSTSPGLLGINSYSGPEEVILAEQNLNGTPDWRNIRPSASSNNTATPAVNPATIAGTVSYSDCVYRKSDYKPATLTFNPPVASVNHCTVKGNLLSNAGGSSTVNVTYSAYRLVHPDNSRTFMMIDLIVVPEKVDGADLVFKPKLINAGILQQRISPEIDRFLGSFYMPGTDLGVIPTTTNGRNAPGATIPNEVIQWARNFIH